MGEMHVGVCYECPNTARCLMVVGTEGPDNTMRIIATEVGGGFGSKIPFYADEIIAAFCAMQTGRPIKWTATRSEGYLATIHGRDHVQHVDMAATTDGKITGPRPTPSAGTGA